MGEGGFWVGSGPHPEEQGLLCRVTQPQQEAALSLRALLTAGTAEETKNQNRSPVPELGHTRWGRGGRWGGS